MAKKLPTLIYGKWVNPDTDNEYFSADPDAESLVDEKGDTARVGIYKLAGYADVSNSTVVKTVGNAKRRK